MASTIQLRRDTSTNWTTNNPILLSGELGIETDSLQLKIGDGSTAWTSLDYYNTVSNNFSFEDIRESLEISQYQQMVVAEEIAVDSGYDLNIEGTLALID